jgi:hypothetical protein
MGMAILAFFLMALCVGFASESLALSIGSGVGVILLIMSMRGLYRSITADAIHWTSEAVQRVYQPHEVGKLIETLHFGNEHTRPGSRAALAEMLPRLTLKEAASISYAERQYLYPQMTGNETNSAFLLAALNFVRFTLDANALPRVRSLAKSAKDRGVKAAAQECAVFLEAHINRHRELQMLLRPTDSYIGEQSLLRTVKDGESSSTDALLRPAEPGR